MRKERYRVGIDVGGTKIHTAVAAVGRNGIPNIIAEARIPTEAGASRRRVFGNICRSVVMVCETAGIEPGHIWHIGIGVPGPVDYGTGTVRVCPNIPSWKRVPVRQWLEKRFECKVSVENDARTAGLAEAIVGAGKGFERVFYVTVSTGIGGAFIQRGDVYHGAHGVAGEIGQTRFPDGTVFEQMAAGPAVERLFGIAPEQIPDLVRSNDARGKAALDHLTRTIGVWLANIATLLDPDIIVVGGGLSHLGALFLAPLRGQIRAHAFSESDKVKVVRAKLGKRSGVIGALLLED